MRNTKTKIVIGKDIFWAAALDIGKGVSVIIHGP